MHLSNSHLNVKIIMKKVLIMILAVAFVAGSCSKYVDGYEFSPNSPTESNEALLTTVIQVATFAHFGGEMARLPSYLTQQTTGVQFQAQERADYTILEGDVTNEWASLYSAMNDCNILIEKAGDINPYYRGIGGVLKAMNLGLTTDLWGDVPNSQANQGEAGEASWNPAYDSQQSVYASIQSILDAAISDLGAAEADNAILPGTDDLIFNGDAAAWLATAHVLKARYANHLSKRDAAGSATAALAALDNAYAAGFTSSASDCNAFFPGDGNSLNQWYAYQTTRANYIKMSAPFMALLAANGDPRLPFYASLDDNGGYSGTAIGDVDVTTSNVGPYFASPTSSTPLVTYAEAKFIEAEAAMRATNPTRAALAHNEAILAHVAQVTGSAAPQAFIDAHASETAGTITMDKIMTQKYVAMFTQSETWTDWRRTNIPALTPNPNGVANGVTVIPRRLPTSRDERNYNTNAQVQQDITVPVWWDE